MLRILGGARSVIVGWCEARWSLRPSAPEVYWMSGFGGIAAVGFGLLLLGWPGPGDIALPWLLGIAAWLSGVLYAGGALIELAGGTSRFEAEPPAA